MIEYQVAIFFYFRFSRYAETKKMGKLLSLLGTLVSS